MSPSEQLFSVSDESQRPVGQGQTGESGPGTPIEVVTRRAATASPTLFQIGGPSLEGEEEREEGGETGQESKEVGDTACWYPLSPGPPNWVSSMNHTCTCR